RFLATVRENKMEKRLDEMVNAYRAGDGPKLSRVVQEEFGTSAEGLAARKRVFDDRHPAMAEAIDSYFKQPDSHFVVIGVGHMFGDNNLLEALAKRGVQARRVE
ncbi:MAG TPA: TraB/GumN family protein, partial [Casimicrobium huifangae]|nr:TraB/GumN family protein [Casimicrobium huifangae]